MRRKLAENRVFVCHLTGMSEEEYSLFRYDLSELWLEKVLKAHDEDCLFLLGDKIFRGWWNYQYARMEDEYLSKVYLDLDVFEYYLKVEEHGEIQDYYEHWQLLTWYQKFIGFLLASDCESTKLMVASFNQLLDLYSKKLLDIK